MKSDGPAYIVKEYVGKGLIIQKGQMCGSRDCNTRHEFFMYFGGFPAL